MEFDSIVLLTTLLMFFSLEKAETILNVKRIHSEKSSIFKFSHLLNWKDASTHCDRLGAGLLHRNDFRDIPTDTFDGTNKSIWIGLKWVNDRLQWMSYHAHEEPNLEEITKYANMRSNSSSLCYSLNNNMEIHAELCEKKLPYICALPSRHMRDAVKFPCPDTISEPEIIFSGDLTTTNPPYAIRNSSNIADNFTLECSVQKNSYNSVYRFRWLVNGGYRHKRLIYNLNKISITDLVDSNQLKNDSYFKFFGKISCEIFCPTTATTRHSRQRIVLSVNTVSLRIEFGFSTLNLTLMMQYFDLYLMSQIPNLALGSNDTLVRDEVPFLSDHAGKKNKWSFSFYAHFEELAENNIERLAAFLMTKEGSGFWLPEQRGIHDPQFHLFDSIEIYILNYCVKPNRNQPEIAFAHKLRKRHEEQAYDINMDMNITGCSLASYQCVADWFSPAKWQFANTSKDCTRCVARFEEYQGRCLRALEPKPFHQSVASCLSGHRKLDHYREISWSFNEWIRLSLMWIHEQNHKHKLYWLPLRRRIAMGPLFPVSLWEFEESENLTRISMDHLPEVIKKDIVSWNTSELDSSLDCLAFDVGRKKAMSVPCYSKLPMVCVRPELVSPNRLADTLEKQTESLQCPADWHTSLLFPDKDVCYKIFPASSISFYDASLSCQKEGGQLAIAHDSSTRHAIQALLETLTIDRANRIWIGLWKAGSQLWDESRINFPVDSENDEDHINVEEEYEGPIMLPTRLTGGRSAATAWEVWSHWKVNGYICEKKTILKQEIELHIDNRRPSELSVGVTFKPVSSQKDHANVNELLERPVEEQSKSTSKVELRISCYIGRDYAYQKTINIGKAEVVEFSVLQQNKTANLFKWLGPEVRCETWEAWTPEPLRTSWILPGDTTATLTSFVIRFRHLNVTYAPTSHDPTFMHQTELYKSTLTYLKKLFHEEFVQQYEAYNTTLLEPGTDPLVFQRDNEATTTSSSLMSSYRIFINVEGQTGLEDQAFIDLNKFLTAKFRSSNNQSNATITWVDLKATEFCPSHVTRDRGEFVEYTDSKTRFEHDLLNTRPNTLIWPKIRAGELITSEYPCISTQGILIERRCLGDQLSGLSWESLKEKIPSDSDVLCSAEPSSRVKRLLDLLMKNEGEILESVKRELEDAEELSVSELQAISYDLESAAKDGRRASYDEMQHLDNIIEKVLKEETLSEAQRNSGFSSKVAHSVEHLLSTCGDNLRSATSSSPGTAVELIKRPFMVASSVTPNQGDKTILGFSAEIVKGNITRSTLLLTNTTYHEAVNQSDVMILLSTGAVPHHPKVNAFFAVYPDTRLVDASAAVGNVSSLIYEQDSDNSNAWHRTEDLYMGNGGMAQVKVSSSHVVTRGNPLTILFRPKTKLTVGILPNLRCVFWESRANAGKGGWSTAGCWMDGTLDGLVVCRCNHLSTFTLLVSRAEVDLRNTVHGTVLSIFTIVGALISILGLSCIVITFISVRNWRKPLGHRIIFQLSIALILLLLTFISGVNNVKYPTACQAAGVALHYFLLVTFAWMTVEAYIQYLFLVKVFDTYVPRLLLKASLIAWCAPIVPVAVVLAIDSRLYNGNEGYCWIDKSAFYPAVVAPLVILLLVNLAVFILIIRSLIMTGRSVMRNTLITSKRNTQKAVAAVFNCFLLGLTWTFGFLAVGPVTSVIFSYLFCFTTVLQGFFIFLFYLVRDSSMRAQWAMWFGRVIKTKEKETVSSGSVRSTHSFLFASGNTSHGTN